MGSTALAQAWRCISQPGSRGSWSATLLELGVCKAHSHGPLLIKYAFHFCKPIWLEDSFSTKFVMTCCVARRVSLSVVDVEPALTEPVVSGHTQQLGRIALCLTEYNVPSVALDKIVPNQPPN